MSETEFDRRRCGVLPGAFRVARGKSENVAVDGRYCYWRWHTTSIGSVSRRAEEIDRALDVVVRLKELVHSRFDPDDDDQDGGDDDDGNDGRHTRRVRYTCAITFFRANYVSGVCCTVPKGTRNVTRVWASRNENHPVSFARVTSLVTN